MDAVYRRAPNFRRPNRASNADDSLFRRGRPRSLIQLRRGGADYVGSIKMGVHRS